MGKLLSLLVVGFAMMSVTRAAAVLADRQLVGFPRKPVDPGAFQTIRLTESNGRIFTSAWWDLESLDARTATPVPSFSLLSPLNALREFDHAAGIYRIHPADTFVAMVGTDLRGPEDAVHPQFLLLGDRRLWPQLVATYLLGEIRDPRSSGLQLVSSVMSLGNRVFLGMYHQLPFGHPDELTVPGGSGLVEIPFPGAPLRNLSSTNVNAYAFDDLRFVHGRLVTFLGHHPDDEGFSRRPDRLAAWEERDGRWEVVWKLPAEYRASGDGRRREHFVGVQNDGFWVTDASEAFWDHGEPLLSWVRITDGVMRAWTNAAGHELPVGKYTGTVFKGSIVLAHLYPFVLDRVGTNAVPGIVALDPETRTVLPWRPREPFPSISSGGIQEMTATERYVLLNTGTELRAYAERGAVWLDPAGTTGSELRLRLTGTQGDRVVVESSGDLRQWEEMSVRELRTEANLDVVVPTTAEARWFRARVVESL